MRRRTFLGTSTAAALAAPALLRAQSAHPLRIGQMEDLSQPATGPAALELVRMAIEDVGGTVLGRPIELLTINHQSKPDVALAMGRQWFDANQVQAIVGTSHSAIAAGLAAIATDKHRVLIANAANADLTGRDCRANAVEWHTDTVSLSRVGAKPVLERGLKRFFFLTVDYVFGHALQRETTAIIEAAGGRVVGMAKHPLGQADYSAYLLEAQASGAEVLAFANSGVDFQNALKQAAEFGLPAQGMTMLGLNPHITDVYNVGLQLAQGLLVADAWNWDIDEDSRAFGHRVLKRTGVMPTALITATYSGTRHYFKAMEAAGTDEAGAVLAKMRELPVTDIYAKNGHLRVDGRMVHDMLLFEVKKPAESSGVWDYYKLSAKVPGDVAFRALDQGQCPLATLATR